MSTNDQETHPRVFISYSHDSPEHADKVLEFANKLRSEGIDAILDQYEESPTEGWPKWMDRQIENSDFILVICTERYYQKVMGTVEGGEGLGVKWESTLVYQDLYDAGAETSKYIPVLFRGATPSSIPKPLRGATYYEVDIKDRYEALYWWLRQVDLGKKALLGKLKPLPGRELKTNFFEENVPDGSTPNTGENRKVNRLKLVITIISVPVSMATIYGVYLAYSTFIESRGPCLRAVVDCEHWKDPCDVEEELKCIAQVSHVCKALEKVVELVDPNIMVDELCDVCDLTCEIAGEICKIWPCEANHVDLLESMHTVKMQNDGGKSIRNLGIIFEKAKYVEYQKEGEEKKRIRGQEQRIIPFGDLRPDATIDMSVWATCGVSRHPEFIIRHSRRPQDIYIRTPVGTVARFVNKYRKTSYALVLLPCVGLILTASYVLIIRKRMRKPTIEMNRTAEQQKNNNLRRE